MATHTPLVQSHDAQPAGAPPRPAFVAYYRVSTDKQGKSGLGLDAQRQAVAAFVAARGAILAEYTEVESGRKRDRPQLLAALSVCRRQKATLAFISNLMESRVDFVAVDMPEANRLTIHILAAVAEHERELIAKRTKAALQVAKTRGVRLGNPQPEPAACLARAALQAQTTERHATVRPLLLELQRQGLGLQAIARELNRRQVPTARGGLWYATSVRNVLAGAGGSAPPARRRPEGGVHARTGHSVGGH
jgi:DNA invertase Pin-like site-specific DNA recombinase